jgi:hypothetical protein
MCCAMLVPAPCCPLRGPRSQLPAHVLPLSQSDTRSRQVRQKHLIRGLGLSSAPTDPSCSLKYSGHPAFPGVCWGWASWQQTGQCGLSPSPPLLGRKRGRVFWVGESVSLSLYGGCDYAQYGGGTGWYNKGHKRRL